MDVVKKMIAALLLMLPGCGPMNQPPPAPQPAPPSAPQPASQPAPDQGSVPGAGGQKVPEQEPRPGFLIEAKLVAAEGVEGAPRSPVLGENTYAIRVVRADDAAPPSPPSAGATLKATYRMPEMPDMGRYEESAERQADGAFKVTLFFSMSGRWQVVFQVKDGSVENEYVLEAKVD